MNEKIRNFLSYLQKYMNNDKKLRELQIFESKNVILKDIFSYPPSRIAGIDLAYKNNSAYTACVTLDFNTLKILEEKVIFSNILFPYKPTFFVFREGPPILDIISKLETIPDVILINSHGICHPLGIGAASHIGILINKSTIGVAQRLLCGNVDFPKNQGEYSHIFHKNQIVGFAYLSKLGTNPIFISPGNFITLDTSIKIIKKTVKAHKLPEPLRLAHELANSYKSKK